MYTYIITSIWRLVSLSGIALSRISFIMEKTLKKKKHIIIYFWDVIYGYISRPERLYIIKICRNLDLSPTVVISHFSPTHYKIKSTSCPVCTFNEKSLMLVFLTCEYDSVNNSLTNIFYSQLSINCTL